MQTNFTLAQLADPDIQEANDILRACVHCGFCTATCPTYVTLGDELDSPRGRIYQIKDMLENEKPAPAKVVKHIDRCLSCLSCMTTCPSGVHYMHLVDHARAYIEETHTRSLKDRFLREVLGAVLPNRILLRLALVGAWIAKPLGPLLGLIDKRFAAMLKLAPGAPPKPSPVDTPQVFPATGPAKLRVALLNGCAQPVLQPHVNEATVRLLTRLGVEVPNATVMVILDADRFGIAQLHQLRGRVGRGEHASTCWLVTQAGEEGATNPRIDALVSTTDGFELAEVDLDLRGEGTRMSTAQKGRSDLKLASLRRDRKLVELAREAAFEIVGTDPDLSGNPGLADELDLIFSDRDEEFLTRS